MMNIFRLCLLIGYVLACYSFVVRVFHRVSSSIQSKKYECELPDGFVGPKHSRVVSKPKESIPVTNLDDLKDLIRQGKGFRYLLRMYFINIIMVGYRVQDLDVRGDAHSTFNISSNHAVIKALHERLEQGSEPGSRKDGKKIAIAIEGGGMRGCVAAGILNYYYYIIHTLITYHYLFRNGKCGIIFKIGK